MTGVDDRHRVPTCSRAIVVLAVRDVDRVGGRVDSQLGRPIANRGRAHEGRPQRTLACEARGKVRQSSGGSGTGTDDDGNGKGHQAARAADAA